ncbi:MAG: hypothetical protein PHC80_07005 [Eubacteriales bacterium]|nr:hypothetical protein [Eubacteriales bacterium]
MKRIGVCILCCILLLCGCQQAAPAPEDVLDVTAEKDSLAQGVSGDTVKEGQTRGSFTVLHTAAYVFEGEEGVTLYGAVEYRNDADTPLWLSGVTFDFAGEQSCSQSFVPALAEYDRVDPGAHGYAAGWFPAEEFAPGAQLTLTATLSQAASGGAYIPLTVSDLFLADNYPAFTTMTGTLTNETDTDCALNMIHTAFYDENGQFLGVWYFPTNAQLNGMDSVRFATHLRSFPIKQLSEKAVDFSSRAFGFH